METYTQKARRLALLAMERGNMMRACMLWEAAGLSDASFDLAPLDFEA